MMPTIFASPSDDVGRMIEEGRKAVDERICQMKAKALADGHGDVHLGMFWLIQEPCWNGEVGDFLIYQLKLNPYEEWNTIIAGDERAARLLGIPLHPGGVIPYLAEERGEAPLQLRDKLRAAHEEVQRTHEFGRFQDVFEDTQAKVKRMAQMFGEELVDISRNMLRKRDRSSARKPVSALTAARRGRRARPHRSRLPKASAPQGAIAWPAQARRPYRARRVARNRRCANSGSIT